MKRIDVIGKVRLVLLKRRDALKRTLDADIIGLSSNRELQPVGDFGDDAHETSEGELCLRLAESECRELQSIDRALKRIRERRYGICEKCDRKISVARMTAIPYTTLCIDCQLRYERITPNRSAATWIDDVPVDTSGPYDRREGSRIAVSHCGKTVTP